MVNFKFLFLVLLLVIPIVSSQSNLDVQKTEGDLVVFTEKNEPATYTLKITNQNSVSDKFQIYSLIGVTIEPKDFFTLGSKETKTLDIRITPHEETKDQIRGFYNFEYQIKGQKTGFFKDTLKIKILEVSDAIEISTTDILPGDKNAKLTIKNLEKTNIDNLNIKLDSEFFEYGSTISLGPEERKIIDVSLDQESYSKLQAGKHDLAVDFEFNGIKSYEKTQINYLEKEDISTIESSTGLIIKSTEVSKKNEGNVPVNVAFEVKKNILTRLFTTTSQSADEISKQGFMVNYYWLRTLEPGEEIKIKTTTNYTFPFILVIAIALLVWGIKVYLGTDLTIKKRVSHVKTKGGDFALKVRLHIKARKEITDIELIDLIPGGMKLYDSFTIRPSKIDPSTRKLHWHLPRLNSGEERVFSYIVYSKIRVVGQFTLPQATAKYKLGAKKLDVQSNRTTYIGETTNYRED